MKSLSLTDLRLGLEDLLNKRISDLTASSSGTLYKPMLEKKLADLQAIPGVSTGGTPLATELAEADAKHDDCGTAIWHILQAYRTYPGIKPEIKKVAEKIEHAFIPSLQELNKSYATEAEAALTHKKRVTQFSDDLKKFPMLNNLTLLDWVNEFISAGESINALLSKRADEHSLQQIRNRKGTAGLRSATLGLLHRLRSALHDELEINLRLSRDLDLKVFGYIDELARARESLTKQKSTVPEPLSSSNTSDEDPDVDD